MAAFVENLIEVKVLGRFNSPHLLVKFYDQHKLTNPKRAQVVCRIGHNVGSFPISAPHYCGKNAPFPKLLHWQKFDSSLLLSMIFFVLSVRVVFGHHVWVGLCLWAIELTRVVRKIPHFGIGIVWGAIPMSFPVFWISVSGRSLNSYGTSPNLWVKKELDKFRQCTQDTWLRFAKFLKEFLGYPPFNLLGDLGDVILG